jgi:hypothetical protein
VSLKKTDMVRLKAANLNDRLRKAAPPERYAKGAHAPSRREQRERDRAQEKQAPLNEVVAELLVRGLEA